MTSLEYKRKLIEQEAQAELEVDMISAACILIVLALVTFEFWRYFA
jgi:hypothetical protein